MDVHAAQLGAAVEGLLKVRFLETRIPDQVPEHANSQRTITVNRNDEPLTSSRPAEHVMAPAHPQEYPTMALQDSGEFLARDGFHTAISSTRPLLRSSSSSGSMSTDR